MAVDKVPHKVTRICNCEDNARAINEIKWKFA